MITGGYFGARANFSSAGYTNILYAAGAYNASGDGFFTSARVWAEGSGTSAKVGTWYNTGTNKFKNRDYAEISPGRGDVTIYGLNIEAVAGDYIGIYDLGTFRNTGKSRWYKVGDGTVNEYTYSTYSSYWTNLYMEGNEAGGSKAFMHYLRHLMAGGVGRQC